MQYVPRDADYAISLKFRVACTQLAMRIVKSKCNRRGSFETAPTACAVNCCENRQLAPLPSISGPNKSHVSPLNFISRSCSIGAKSVGEVLILMPGR